jgi:transitional endoplasmic reticulum ATPase
MSDLAPHTRQFGWYLKNALESGDSDRLFRAIASSAKKLEHEGNEEGAVFNWDEIPLGGGRKRSLSACKKALATYLETFDGREKRPGPLEMNVGYACERFNLDKVDAKILLLILRYVRNPILQEFTDRVLRDNNSIPRTTAILCGIKPEIALEKLSAGSALIDNGLLTLNPEGTGFSGQDGELEMTPVLSRIMMQKHADVDAWASALLGRQLYSSLEWSDYDHLEREADMACRMLGGWATEQPAGTHVMLVGATGTGKTEFAKTLAARSGLSLWAVGETDEAGDEPTRYQRMAALKLSLSLLKGKTQVALLMDEAEDILDSIKFSGANRMNISKAFMNRTLETSSVPIIWTTNRTDSMDPATLRRMTMFVEMKSPERKVRERVWQRILKREGMDLPSDSIERMARQWNAPPALAANAVKAAKMSGGGEHDIETALVGLLAGIGMGMAPPERDGADFDPLLAVCDEDMIQLENELCAPDAGTAWSLCLYGPSGTGKSEFARHLATRLGMPVLHKRSSDLVSKWVGETDQKIAAAFTEARTKRAMLILDEADSMMLDRRGADRQHEISQVNEMLTWMEDHPLPFVCTTNLMDKIDKAALRRFTFKIKFQALDARRRKLAFHRFFGFDLPDRIILPDGLTPGDFAAVRKKTTILKIKDPIRIAAWLQGELDVKVEKSKPVGFGADIRG